MAEQIKNLSEQSNESSKEIEATAEVLRADSEKAVQAMQQMQEIIASPEREHAGNTAGCRRGYRRLQAP